MTTIEAWAALKDNFRVAAIGYVRPFPLRQGPPSPQVTAVYERYVAKEVDAITKRCGIVVESVELSRRWGPADRDPTAAMHGLVVYTSSDNTEKWREAAMSILGRFQIGDVYEDSIEIEVSNRTLMSCNCSFLLPEEKELLDAIHNLRPKVLSKVQTLCPTQWTSIAYHARRPKRSESLGHPTVLVFCRPGSIGIYAKLELSILEILKLAPVALALEILPGVLSLSSVDSGSPKIYSNLPEQPSNGSSIGVDGDDNDACTLGGWLHFRQPDLPDRKVFMTVYHLLNPKKAPLDAYEAERGIRSDDSMSEKPQVTYPASFDSRATISSFRKAIQNLPQQASDLTTRLARFEALAARPPIGRIFAGSGKRRNDEGRRMDWLLVESPATFRSNKPSPPSAFINAIEFPSSDELSYKLSVDSAMSKFGVLKLSSWVAKNGRSTGVTSGWVHTVGRDVNWENGMVTIEAEIKGNYRDFADHCDSGSFIHDEEGDLVGMLIGQDFYNNDFNSGFVSRIQDIIRDVKERTGGDLSLE